MASITPRTVAGDWLLRATTKLQKSIYRMAEHKYRSIIKGLEDERDENLDVKLKLENDLSQALKEIRKLKGETNYEKLEEVHEQEVVHEPKVVQDPEVFLVKPILGKIIVDATKQRKRELNKEIDELEFLRDAPPQKLLKAAPPAPRSIPPLVTPKPKALFKKRERSTSPQLVSNYSPVPTVNNPNNPPIPLVDPEFRVRKKKRKRRNQKL